MIRSRTYLFAAAIILTIGLVLPPKQTMSVPAAVPAAPTYYRDIQPIVAEHCVSCHSDGQSAPFSLVTYHDVEKRSMQIAQITKAVSMPPWKPDSHGELVGENRLSPKEIAILQEWSDRGAPAGEETSRMAFAHIMDNALGTPDTILTPSSPSVIPPDGADFYRCFVLPTHYDTDKYLAAIVFQSGNPKVCDHALEYLDVHKQVRFMNRLSPGEGFTVQRSTAGLQCSMLIGGWGPSTPQERFPDGSGILLPNGSDIILEVHYLPTGKPETDLPHVLLYFSNSPVTHRVRIAPVVAHNLRLSANLAGQSIGGQSPVVSDISILSVLPYLRHYGAAIRIDALAPNKSQTTVLSIPQWDFDWVGNYQFHKPVPIKAGSILTMVASFNTAVSGTQNPPAGENRIVTWGDTPQDENAVVYVFYTTDDEIAGSRTTAGIPKQGEPTQAAMDRILLKMFDTNHDGTIDTRERLQMGKYFIWGMPSIAGMEM